MCRKQEVGIDGAVTIELTTILDGIPPGGNFRTRNVVCTDTDSSGSSFGVYKHSFTGYVCACRVDADRYHSRGRNIRCNVDVMWVFCNFCVCLPPRDRNRKIMWNNGVCFACQSITSSLCVGRGVFDAEGFVSICLGPGLFRVFLCIGFTGCSGRCTGCRSISRRSGFASFCSCNSGLFSGSSSRSRSFVRFPFCIGCACLRALSSCFDRFNPVLFCANISILYSNGISAIRADFNCFAHSNVTSKIPEPLSCIFISVKLSLLTI